MTESFAQLFEQSLANQRIRPGQILTGLVVDVGADVVVVNVGLKSEAVIPLEQFKNERGEIEVKVGDERRSRARRVEDGSGETRLSREKAKRARTWTRLEEAFDEGRDRHGHHQRPRQGRLHRRDRQRPRVPARFARRRAPGARHRATSKARRSSSRSSSSTRSATTSSCRAARSSSRNTAPSASSCSTTCRKAPSSRASSRTSPTTARSSTSAASTACCTSPTWRGSASSIRRKSSTSATRSTCASSSSTASASASRSGLKQLGADPWAEHRAPLPAGHAPVRQGHEHRRLRLLRGDRGGRRRPGPRVRDGLDQQERQPGQGRAHRRGSRGHGARHRRGAPPHLARHQAVQAEPVEASSPRTTTAATRSRARSSRSPTSASSSACPAASTASCTCPTSPGTCPAKRPCATTRRARRSRPWCCRSIRSASASRSASSSSRKDPFSTYIAEHPKGSIVKGVGQGSRRAGARSIDLGGGIEGHLRASELARDRVEDARTVLKVGDEVEARFTGVDRKSRTIALSIKAKEVARGGRGGAELPLRATRRPGTSLGDLLKEQISGQ